MSVIGVVGLGTMGMNLARNLGHNGYGVSVYNRHTARVDSFMQQFGNEGAFEPARSAEELVAQLEPPRAVLMMVTAGPAVDELIDHLAPSLKPGDILIDGGNSWFLDTARREQALQARGLRFVGAGVSGGEEGALHGPSIMPGGPREAYDRIGPLLEQISAHVNGDPCCTYIGPDGAGHYVKMVHNGIEYADIQLIAESYDLLSHELHLDASELSGIFAQWNRGDLESYLIQITAEVLGKRDRATGKALVDVILDEAEQKGTGKWTSQQALDLGIPANTITEGVFARFLSALKDDRDIASRALAGPNGAAPSAASDSLVDDVRAALYASMIVAYTQGFELMQAASSEYKWNLKPGDIARIWRGGCIIRARFLNRITDAYSADASIKSLMLVPYFRDILAGAQDAWRRVIALAIERGIPVPAFSSSLAYYDGYRRERLPANLVQGLRDYFGAHTYRRIDRQGSFHTRWAQDGEEVAVKS